MGFFQFLSMVMPFLMAGQQRKATESANEANIERFDESKGLLEGLRQQGSSVFSQLGRGNLEGLAQRVNRGSSQLGQLQRQLGNRMGIATGQNLAGLDRFRDQTLGNLRGDLATNLGAFSQFADPLNRGFRQREGNILGGFDAGAAGIRGELEGLGTQEGLDIDEASRRTGASQAAGLAARGLGGTTISSTMARGVEGQRTAAQSRLSERLQRQRADIGLNLLGQRTGLAQMLSGDRLAAQERLGAGGFELGRFGRAGITDAARGFGGARFDIGAAGRQGQIGLLDRFGAARMNLSQQFLGDRLGSQERFGLGGLNFDSQMVSNLVNLITGRSDVGPDQSSFLQLMQGFGGFGVPKADKPSSGGSFGRFALNALGNAAGSGSITQWLLGGGGGGGGAGASQLPLMM